MFKKTVILSLILTLIFPAFDFALAGETDYSVVPSVSEVYYGEKVTFDITTPSEVSVVKVYLDGRYNCRASLVSSGQQNNWTITLTFKKLGARKVYFKAYSSRGKLLSAFPSPSVLITVNHYPPVTKSPIILDSDKVVLLGVPPVNCGVRQRGYGFYFGTDPGNLTTKVVSNKIIRNEMNRLVDSLSSETIYYYQCYVITSAGTFTGNIVSFTTPASFEWTSENVNIADISQRYVSLFGTDAKFYKFSTPPFGYATSSEASKHMVTIDVPVWKISRGKKVSAAMHVTINYKLKSSVLAIFQDIYALELKFPICSLKGYSYRRVVGPGVTGTGMMSHHSFGTAIDINKKYNGFYRNKDKRNVKSPYYIPQDVIDVFAKYGWYWGGNFKEGYDTMHFQYLGLDLLG